MRIYDAAAQGLIVDETNDPIHGNALDAMRIDPTAELAGRLVLQRGVSILWGAQLGYEVSLGRDAHVESGVYLGDQVAVGSEGRIGIAATVLSQAVIGRRADVLAGVVIAHGVRIPDYAQIGERRIIPTQQAIMALSPVGRHHRVVTIHGGPEGPEYSAGCQYSDSWQEFWDRIVYATETTTESARNYRDLKRSFQAIGTVVQRAYDAAAANGAIDRLREEAGRVRTQMPVHTDSFE